MCVLLVLNEVDHAVCLKAEFQRRTALSNEIGKFYTTVIYPCYSNSICFSMWSPAWWRIGLCSRPGVQAGVPSCPDDMTLRSCANFKCDIPNVNKSIRTDFRGVKCVFRWVWATISWKYFIIYQVRLFSTEYIQPKPSCILFSTFYWLLLQTMNRRQ